jgi:replicative DNA helicase
LSKIFDTESELALITLIIKNPEKIFEILDIKWFMFSTVSYQVIWSAVEELREQNLIPEKTLLFSKIESEGKLQEAGGKDFLDIIVQQDYKVENIREFERNIVNNYRIKQILTVLGEVQQKVKSNLPVDEVLSSIKDEVSKIENFSQGAETVSMLTATKDAWEDIKNKIDNPGVPGFSTGYTKLDLTTYGYNPGKLWVIAARPSMGKTASMLNSVLALGKQNVPTLVLSKEMKYVDLVKRMIATESLVSISDLMLGNFNQAKVNAVQDTIQRLKEYPIIINDQFQPFDLTSAIRKAVVAKGVKVVFIDYLQLLSDRGEDQTEELGRMIRSLKLLAVELDITIVVLSQLNRLVELRPDKRPILSDIRQCGNVEEDVDIAVFLYRDEIYDSKTKHVGEMEYLIRKNRDGAIGTLVFKFDAPSNKITEEDDL